MLKYYYVYCLTNWNNRRIYTGVTSNLQKRIYEHKHKLIEGHTSKYNISKLVYYETFDSIENAICREKEIKGWVRMKKDALIEKHNPEYNDLYRTLF